MSKQGGYLVAISTSPHSEYIIRWTQTRASVENERWCAVYIQRGEPGYEGNEILKKNMNVAVDLGGEVITASDDNIARGILRVAGQNGFSHIVAGKTQYKKIQNPFFRKSIIEELLASSGAIDVFIITQNDYSVTKKSAFTRIVMAISRFRWREYLLVSLFLFSLVSLNLYLRQYISYLSVGFLFLTAVSVVSCLFQRGAVLFFAGMSAVLWNFLFLQPHYTFMIDKLEDLLMFLMYFLTAFIIGNLTTRLRQKEYFLRTRERVLEELYRMSKVLNTSNDIDEMTLNSIAFLHQIFHLDFSLYTADETRVLESEPCKGSDFLLNDKEFAIAQWVLANAKSAGKDSEFFCESKLYYLPMKVRSQAVAVCVIREHDGNDQWLSVDRKNLLFTLISQIASSFERHVLNRSRQKLKLAQESEKLFQILLNTVSHELRTPITTINNAANGLLDEALISNGEIRTLFANDIIESSDRLNRVVDNLLGSIKIESGRLTLNLEWHDVSDLVNVVTGKLQKYLQNHNFIYSVKSSVTMVKFDFGLMEQLLTNLLYNAALYTHAGGNIELKIEQDEVNTTFSISDNGPGIAGNEREKIFQKFYRAKGNKKGGLGLGLSICKEIAEIHKGTIALREKNTSGALFVVSLPLEQSTLREED